MKKWLWIAFGLVVFGVEGFQAWQLSKLKKDFAKDLADLRWDLAEGRHDRDDAVIPEVGTIQFLKAGGYSIQFDVARYTADGLHLEGFVGNPSNLWISNLSLKFTATKKLYQYKDDFLKDELSFLFVGPTPVGEAQCSPIEKLGPSQLRRFEITIPNVRHTKEGIRIVVSFSEERYSYVP